MLGSNLKNIESLKKEREIKKDIKIIFAIIFNEEITAPSFMNGGAETVGERARALAAYGSNLCIKTISKGRSPLIKVKENENDVKAHKRGKIEISNQILRTSPLITHLAILNLK